MARAHSNALPVSGMDMGLTEGWNGSGREGYSECVDQFLQYIHWSGVPGLHNREGVGSGLLSASRL